MTWDKLSHFGILWSCYFVIFEVSSPPHLMIRNVFLTLTWCLTSCLAVWYSVDNIFVSEKLVFVWRRWLVFFFFRFREACYVLIELLELRTLKWVTSHISGGSVFAAFRESTTSIFTLYRFIQKNSSQSDHIILCSFIPNILLNERIQSTFISLFVIDQRGFHIHHFF